jgi:hypothetical protein
MAPHALAKDLYVDTSDGNKQNGPCETTYGDEQRRYFNPTANEAGTYMHRG